MVLRRAIGAKHHTATRFNPDNEPAALNVGACLDGLGAHAARGRHTEVRHPPCIGRNAGNVLALVVRRALSRCSREPLKLEVNGMPAERNEEAAVAHCR